MIYVAEALLKVRAGKNGASNSPVKNRTTQKLTPLLIAAVHIVQMDQASIMVGKYHRGFDLARKI